MLDLTGLTAAPAQVRGAFRLVPLLRDAPCEDVRLSRHAMPPGYKVVELPDNMHYFAFVPHALLLQWDDHGAHLAALGGQVHQPGKDTFDWCGIQYVDKLRKRQAGGLRFLPLHLALEGLLALHFAPPRVKWPELSREFLRSGLGFRSEGGIPGVFLPLFEDAMRTFELHRGQVGMLVFVADQLAAAFVVPSADDYAALHRTLLHDLYGELVLRYAMLYPETPFLEVTASFEGTNSIYEMRDQLHAMRREWADFTRNTMLPDLLSRPLITQKLYEPGHLTLERFITDLDPAQINHVGERLTRKNGEVLYLKTFQLSAAQTRRAYLLQQLAQHEWHLPSAASALKTSVPELVGRIEKQDFGYLLSQATRETAAKARRP